jgi:cell division protein FtsB
MEHLLICNLAPRNIKQGFRALTEKKCEKQAEKRMRETLRAEENDLDAQAHNLEQESKRQQGIKTGLKTAMIQNNTKFSLLYYVLYVLIVAKETQKYINPQILRSIWRKLNANT